MLVGYLACTAVHVLSRVCAFVLMTYLTRVVREEFLHMHLNYTAACVCMGVYVWLCVMTESRDHTCKHVI